MQKTHEFNVALLKAIYEALTETLGENTARAMEFYVDSSLAISNINEYTKALKKIFVEGSLVLEKKCVEKLYTSFGLVFEEKENYELPQYVEDARRKFELIP